METQEKGTAVSILQNYLDIVNDASPFRKLFDELLSFEKQINSQSEIIDSLKARIERLEVENNKKSQEIKKLRHFNEFLIRDKMDCGNNLKFSTTYDYGKSSDISCSTYDLYSYSKQKNQGIPLGFEHLKSHIQQITTIYGDCIRLKSFKELKSLYKIEDLIKYTTTPDFNSLNKNSKRYIKFHIKNMLLKEFENQDVILSQNLDEYINRDIIPTLPLGYNNYAEYEYSDEFNNLGEMQKSRVRKLILLGY